MILRLCSFFILCSCFLAERGHSQHLSTDSILRSILTMADDPDKVIAMRTLSREFWKQDKMHLALEYDQRALLLGDMLWLSEAIASEKKEVRSSTNFSSPDSLKKNSERLSQIEDRQRKLDVAVREYNRRNFSFADDQAKTAKEENEKLELRQQAEVQRLSAERAKRTWITTGSIIVLALLSVVFIQISRRRKTKFKLETNQLKNKALRAQLNPHFIFHALNSIRNFIAEHPETADGYLIKFSTLMRQVLENSEEEKISLSEEIAMIENYMQLEAIRLPGGFDYEVALDESIDADMIAVPPLIMQPMIENAILHGLMPLSHRGKIVMRFTRSNGLLEATIEDNGIGLGSVLGTKTVAKKRSFGIHITSERIELLNRKSKAKGALVQQLFETGSKVRIAIPL